MHYRILACDYDGTLASDGQVDEQTVAALKRVRDSGRQLILVTGRQLDDLLQVFSHIDLFERVVAENGALLYRPASNEEQILGDRPPEEFVTVLRDRGVTPIAVGRVVVATWHPHEATIIETIHNLGLELQVILNKDAVMVLPANVNKASGFMAALNELGIPPDQAVGVGDAENDHAFLDLCGYSVAVANALPAVKKHANLVTSGERGTGVVELIDQLITDDLGIDSRLQL